MGEITTDAASDQPAEVTVTFTLAPEDIARFARFTVWHLPYTRANNIALAAVLPALFALGALFITRDWPFAVGAGVLGGAVYVMSIGNAIASATLRRVRQSQDAWAPQTLTISPRGFHQTLSTGEGTIPWTGFRDILVGAGCILFVRSAQSAILVPNRAFAHPSEAEAFYQLARQYWRDARGAHVMREGDRG